LTPTKGTAKVTFTLIHFNRTVETRRLFSFVFTAAVLPHALATVLRPTLSPHTQRTGCFTSTDGNT
jgi:hypothetical protein